MNIFSYHGTLPPRSPLFVGRERELAKLRDLSKPSFKSYVIVFGARQMGKTSLLSQLSASVPPHIDFIRIDLSPLKGHSLDRVYRYIAEELVNRLGVRYAPDSQDVSDGPSFRAFLRRLNPSRFAIIALDEPARSAQFTRTVSNQVTRLFVHSCSY
jgi:hypothetical protein